MTNGTSQGLFVVVAIIIFGISVLISYLLFKDNLKSTLTNIFSDGLEQTGNRLSKIKNIKAQREDKYYLYVRVRKEDKEKNESEIWLKLEKQSNNTLKIFQSNIDDTSNYVNGSDKMTGDLILPDTVNNLKITDIRSFSFMNANFSGNIRLPKFLERIGEHAFFESEFSNNLILPESLEQIDGYAFFHAKFTGNLIIPPKMGNIPESTFRNSSFTRHL